MLALPWVALRYRPHAVEPAGGLAAVVGSTADRAARIIKSRAVV